jgi:hypothetical protein
MKARDGLDDDRQLGRRGGEVTKRTRGHEHYARIGTIGGQHRMRADMPGT